MLVMFLIDLAKAEFSLQIYLVPKKDESLHFCHDYYNAIEVIIEDLCPIPCMDELIYFIGDARTFLELDADIE